MYHYVYKLVHTETSEFYIGSRSCKCHPSLDPYLGSMVTWKPDKNMLSKVIIKDDFQTRSEAMVFESLSIKSNIDNPLNMNFSIPGENFHTEGMVHVRDKNGQKFLIDKNDERIKKGDFHFIWNGKKHSEDSKKKMSSSAKNRNIDEETENLRRNKISETMKGVPKPLEFVENMSKNRRGGNNPYSKYLKENGLDHHSKGKKYEKQECPYCKRMISKSIIKVKHLDNCKEKK